MKINKVEKLDAQTKKDQVDQIHSLKNSAQADKEITDELISTQGHYPFAIEIVSEALHAGVKFNADCKGELDASGAILAALSKCTGGRSTAFFSTTFQLYKYTEKNGKIVNSSSDEISKAAIAKTLKHLKCNSELIKSLLDSGEVFSADTAKKCRIISEVIGLPAIKKLTKKGGNNKKNSGTDKKNEEVVSEKLTEKPIDSKENPKAQSGDKPIEVSK